MPNLIGTTGKRLFQDHDSRVMVKYSFVLLRNGRLVSSKSINLQIFQIFQLENGFKSGFKDSGSLPKKTSKTRDYERENWNQDRP